MPAFLCTTCGTQYPPSDQPPAACVICEEERQYLPPSGQGWTTREALANSHFNAFHQYQPNVIGIGTQPKFAIGQRALLLRTPHGNVLWDCIALLDDATVTLINGLGGIQAIAISHPHFYTTMLEWSRVFNAPLYLNAADRSWIQRNDPAIKFWDGATHALLPEVTLIRCGGHFPGASVLHWAGGAHGRGIVCAGDTLSVTTDRKWLSFMRSYPNFLPLSAREVTGIAKAMAPFSFDVLYGHYFDRVIPAGAKAVLEKSVARYLAAIAGTARKEGE
jgi:glyoxylase-like metal-dependent hydrolase (beta-lactamase superfamily II)